MRTLTEFSSNLIQRAVAAHKAVAGDALEGEALATSIGETLALDGDRLARLIELLENAGDKLEGARLVRVFQGEEAPKKAITIGEFHYVIDRPGQATPNKTERGGGKRDGRGRGNFKPGGPGGYGRDRTEGPRLKPGEVPSGGAGWTLQRAPRDPSDRRGGRDDRKRGPKKPRPNRGDRPRGGPRGASKPRSVGQEPRSTGQEPRASQEAAPPLPQGPKRTVEMPVTDGNAPANKRKRRGGRGRGRSKTDAPRPAQTETAEVAASETVTPEVTPEAVTPEVVPETATPPTETEGVPEAITERPSQMVTRSTAIPGPVPAEPTLRGHGLGPAPVSAEPTLSGQAPGPAPSESTAEDSDTEAATNDKQTPTS